MKLSRVARGEDSPPKTADITAARVHKVLKAVGDTELPQGVTALNAGFFMLEKIRNHSAAKGRVIVRAELRGG